MPTRSDLGAAGPRLGRRSGASPGPVPRGTGAVPAASRFATWRRPETAALVAPEPVDCLVSDVARGSLLLRTTSGSPGAAVSRSWGVLPAESRPSEWAGLPSPRAATRGDALVWRKSGSGMGTRGGLKAMGPLPPSLGIRPAPLCSRPEGGVPDLSGGHGVTTSRDMSRTWGGGLDSLPSCRPAVKHTFAVGWGRQTPPSSVLSFRGACRTTLAQPRAQLATHAVRALAKIRATYFGRSIIGFPRLVPATAVTLFRGLQSSDESVCGKSCTRHALELLCMRGLGYS